MRFVDVSDEPKKKFKSDKAIIDGYYRALEELSIAPDPAKIGERKHGIIQKLSCNSYHKKPQLALSIFS
ncbi:MAG: hypothetical protein ACREBB_07705 [Nitrosotalea sp.]